MGAVNKHNLDEVFSYHRWSPHQIARGETVRGLAKELARAILSSIDGYSDLSHDCRDRALSLLRLAVQEANAAITFDVPQLCVDERTNAKPSEKDVEVRR